MIYFDNNATTAPAPEVLDAMLPYLSSSFGNPSSAHKLGEAPRKAVAAARESVAALIGATAPDEIMFTSCGTESDNWAILGGLQARPDKDHIVATRVEHEAVRKLIEQLELSGLPLRCRRSSPRWGTRPWRAVPRRLHRSHGTRP